jgi:hypothetical protein
VGLQFAREGFHGPRDSAPTGSIAALRSAL